MKAVTPEMLGAILGHAASDDGTAGGSHSLDYAADLMDEHEFTLGERAALWLLAAATDGAQGEER